MRAHVAALAVAVAVLALASCEREQKAIERDLPASRATKARADALQIAGAVRLYQATFGALPPSLDALARAQTVNGVTGGPFLAAIPAPPAGWSAYAYSIQGGERFTISSSGGGATVTAP